MTISNPSDVTFKNSVDQSSNLANEGRQRVEFLHIPSGKTVVFKALLTQFDDAFSSDWESTNSYGRMDPIQTFKRTTRQISFGFDVVAGSIEEATDNQQRVSLLLQMLYPSYDGSGFGASSIKASPYFKLSIMNLSQNQEGNSSAVFKGADTGLLGTLSGFTFSPNLDNGCFFNEKGEFLPKSINLSSNLTVIHQHSLGWDNSGAPIGAQFGQFPYNQNAQSIGANNRTQPTPKTEAQAQNNDELQQRNSSQITRDCDPTISSCPQQRQIQQNQAARIASTFKASGGTQ